MPVPLIATGRNLIRRSSLNPARLRDVIADYSADHLETLFQDSAGTTAVAADGDVVGKWNDRTGNGYHATQGTAGSKPVYKVAGFNGRPCIRFDGTDDFLLMNSLAALFSGSSDVPHTIIAVCQLSAVGAQRTIWGLGRSSSATPFVTARISNTNCLEYSRRNDANTNVVNTSVVSALAANSPQILFFRYSGTQADAYKGNTNVLTLQAAGTGAITLDQAAIGCLPRTTNTIFWTGDIARILVIARSITNAERRAVSNYLSDYYKLNVSQI